MKKADKYELYEHSVQSPEVQTEIFKKIYTDINRKQPHFFREDFCGTLLLSIDWIKSGKSCTAMGIDLDPEPLKYFRKNHLPKLDSNLAKRIRFKKQNVLKITSPKVDIIGACNFSFYIFKKRSELVKYFRSCLMSLRKDGVLVLEMAGGPEMIDQRKEQRTIKISSRKKFRYFWHQKSFNPANRNGKYAIHFKFNDGTWIKNAFTYDWRIWTIPEVRDALIDAGFKSTAVFWDDEKKKGSHNFARTEKMTNDLAWIVQVVGSKSP